MNNSIMYHGLTETIKKICSSPKSHDNLSIFRWIGVGR